VSAPEDPAKSCPYCEKTNDVQVIPDTPLKVKAWSCADCGTEWAVTAVTLQVRPWPDQLVVDVVARSVLREVTTLAEQADTLTNGQLKARLLNCWARLTQACQQGAQPPPASESSAGHRLTNEAPGTQPAPRSTMPPPESGAAR